MSIESLQTAARRRMSEDAGGAATSLPDAYDPRRFVPTGGSPANVGTPERLVAERGTPDTTPVRSRKGRSTYEVSAGHVRFMVGPDPFTDTGELVRIDHRTLVDMADAWVALNDPEQDRPCTCTDLTTTVLVLDRKTRAPIWHTDRQQYLTAERRIRRCHCRPFPALMGLDGGRRNAWHELTPRDDSQRRSGESSTARRQPRTALVARFRTTDPGVAQIDTEGRVTHRSTVTPLAEGGSVERIVSAWADPSHVWHGHTLVMRAAARRNGNAARSAVRAQRRASAVAPDWAPEALALTEALNASDAPEVTVSFPGVAVTVRRNAGTRWAVTIVRGGETVRMRTRTVGPIARAVVA